MIITCLLPTWTMMVIKRKGLIRLLHYIPATHVHGRRPIKVKYHCWSPWGTNPVIYKLGMIRHD